MSMKIYFPGNRKVNVDFNGFTIATDQRISDGGDGTAPAPYELFLSSIGACAGIYVQSFCQSRGLPTEGIELEQNMIWDPIKQKMGKIKIDIKVPPEFPEKYYDALVKTASLCAVKKTIQNPPEFEVVTSVKEMVAV
jgi:ribosomal protein S12 methylthiotransferase accessory factor